MPAVGRPDIVSEAPPPPQFCRMDVDAWDSSKRYVSQHSASVP